MNKIILLFTIVSLLSFSSFGQNSDIDSLRNVANTSTQDTLKIKAMLKLASKLMHSEVEEAESFAQLALDISNTIKNEKWISKSHGRVGNVAFVKRELNKAAKHFNIALTIGKN